MLRSIVTLLLFVMSFNVLAHGRPDTDGPGSWGLLQDTIKLKELTLIKTYIHNGRWAAHFSDKFGDEHILFKSSLIGENTGRIININEQGLTIEQVIQDENGYWVTQEVKLKIK